MKVHAGTDHTILEGNLYLPRNWVGNPSQCAETDYLQRNFRENRKQCKWPWKEVEAWGIYIPSIEFGTPRSHLENGG